MMTRFREAPRTKVPSWDDLRPFLSPVFIDDVKPIEPNLRCPSFVRRFFWWLAVDADQTSREVLAIYNDGAWEGYGDQKAAMKVAAAIIHYIDACREGFGYDWGRSVQKTLSTTFCALRDISARRYPPFEKGLLPIQKSSKRSLPSLGTLDWPELRGLQPSEKDAAALDLIRGEAIAHLADAEAIFAFGQSILASPEPPLDANAECWWLIKEYLKSFHDACVRFGKPSLENIERVNRVSTWVGAGFPRKLPNLVFIRPYQIIQMGSACLGASRLVTAAVKIMFCASTGWNREQIFTLPADPYAFRYEDAAGICSAAFLSSFKNRAGHFVNAHLERGVIDFQLTKENVYSIWSHAKEEIGGEVGASIFTDMSIMTVLDRYEKLTAALRQYDHNADFNDKFFLSLGSAGLSGSDWSVSQYKLGGILQRSAVTYPVTRQTFINVTRRFTGSVDLTRHVAGNTSGIILRHYDDAAIQRELDEAVAFWANCMQTHIVDGRPGLAAHFMLQDEDFEWFRHLSKVAGISASLLVSDRRLKISEPHILEFVPSPEALQELYLIRRGLLAARRRIGDNRWGVQGLAILAVINALRTHVQDAGLAASYAAAVRDAIRKLRKGETVVPNVLD